MELRSGPDQILKKSQWILAGLKMPPLPSLSRQTYSHVPIALALATVWIERARAIIASQRPFAATDRPGTMLIDLASRLSSPSFFCIRVSLSSS